MSERNASLPYQPTPGYEPPTGADTYKIAQDAFQAAMRANALGGVEGAASAAREALVAHGREQVLKILCEVYPQVCGVVAAELLERRITK